MILDLAENPTPPMPELNDEFEFRELGLTLLASVPLPILELKDLLELLLLFLIIFDYYFFYCSHISICLSPAFVLNVLKQ